MYHRDKLRPRFNLLKKLFPLEKQFNLYTHEKEDRPESNRFDYLKLESDADYEDAYDYAIKYLDKCFHKGYNSDCIDDLIFLIHYYQRATDGYIIVKMPVYKKDRKGLPVIDYIYDPKSYDPASDHPDNKKTFEDSADSAFKSVLDKDSLEEKNFQIEVFRLNQFFDKAYRANRENFNIQITSGRFHKIILEDKRTTDKIIDFIEDELLKTESLIKDDKEKKKFKNRRMEVSDLYKQELAKSFYKYINKELLKNKKAPISKIYHFIGYIFAYIGLLDDENSFEHFQSKREDRMEERSYTSYPEYLRINIKNSLPKR